jgi:hypothetical protein
MAVQVLRGAAPAAGTVHFGLQPRDGAGWGPLRWTEALLDQRGIARLEGLRPGRYRITLRFAPEAGAAVRRAPVEVLLTEGRDARLPVFQLTDPRGPG